MNTKRMSQRRYHTTQIKNRARRNIKTWWWYNKEKRDKFAIKNVEVNDIKDILLEDTSEWDDVEHQVI